MVSLSFLFLEIEDEREIGSLDEMAKEYILLRTSPGRVVNVGGGESAIV